MPNRLIHEKSRRSKTLAQLSDFGERLFWRLITVADDWGRFDATPSVVRSFCFPASRVTDNQTRAALDELVKVGTLRLYQVRGEQLGEFIEWRSYQQVRAKKSKFPDPPACDQLQTSDRNCDQLIANENNINTQGSDSDTNTDTSTSPDPNPNPDPDPEPLTVGTPTRAEHQDFAPFWQEYPRKDGKQAAAQVWSRLTAEERRLAAEDVPKRMLANWAGRELKHIPHASTYLNQRRWLDEIEERARLPDTRPRLSPGMERLAQAYREAQARERDGSTQAANAVQGTLAQTVGRPSRPG